MGKQRNIRLRGTVDNIIYYQWKGIDCVRTVPEKVRQSPNTKKAASVFGIAVKSSARLRGLVRPSLPEPGDRSMMYELDNAFRQWLYTNPFDEMATVDNLPFFELFTFNKKAALPKIFRDVTVKRLANGALEVTIPACNPVKEITAPATTSKVEIKLLAVALPFEDLDNAYALQKEASFSYTAKEVPQQQCTFEEITCSKKLVVITMAMRFYKSEGHAIPILQKRWMPVAIISSFYN